MSAIISVRGVRGIIKLVKVLDNSSPFTTRVLVTLGASSLVSVLLLAIRMILAGNSRFIFMIWNLVLAWIPVLFALGLRLGLATYRLKSWQNVVLIVLWLGFLPNSFYLMTDLIHLQSSGEASILYDIGMMMSFIINGLLLGYISLYIVHVQLLKKLRASIVLWFVGFVLLACSFAIYLGRYLRWNTWDIIFNPFGILFDVSERVVNPVLHYQTFIVTGVFFIILSSTYAVIYQITKVLSHNVQKR